MTTTEHLQLNQWAPEDRILRQDFNADNAKLDALASQVLPTLIREVVTESDADTVELDLSDIDWSQWSRVIIESVAICSEGGASNSGIFYESNRARILGYARLMEIGAAEDKGTSILVLLCRNEPQAPVITLSISSSAEFLNTSKRWRELPLIGFTHTYSGDYQICAGSRFRILGVK